MCNVFFSTESVLAIIRTELVKVITVWDMKKTHPELVKVITVRKVKEPTVRV